MAEADTPSIPRRHGVDLKTGRRMARPVGWLIRGSAEPTPMQWQAIGESLTCGDPLMDRVAQWMHSAGMNTAKPLFDRALAQGIAAVPEAPPELRELFAVVDRRPSWVNDALLEEGVRVSGMAGLSGMRALRDLGLLAGYQASAINRTLVLTGALKRGPQRRLAETTKWWIDATQPGGMRREGAGFATTLQVRLIHALVRRHVQRHPEWDASYYGLPVNQGDMHATYLGFSVIFLIGARALGIPVTRNEGRAVMHLWRYIGWLMGLEEQWLHDSERDGRIGLYQNLLAQAPPDDSSRQLGQPLMNEPLQRHYPNFAWLRGHFNRAMHLSIASAFVGRAGLRALGLPTGTLPWYPLINFPLRFAWHVLHRLLPGGRERLVRAGLKAQREYLKTLFGTETPQVKAAHTV